MQSNDATESSADSNNSQRDEAQSIIKKGIELLLGKSPNVERARTSSEVLVIEALHIALRYKNKEEFAAKLYKNRADNNRGVIIDLLSDKCLVKDSSEEQQLLEIALTKSIEMAEAAVSVYFKSVEVAIHSCEEMLNEFHNLIDALPAAIKENIDNRLEFLHRAYIVKGDDDFPAAAYTEGLDVPPHLNSFFGLAFSGGGIRSASFSIGVSQVLSERGYLRAFDYISSVSGGGYAASWLTAWAYRHKSGIRGVSDELRQKRGQESGPLRWVRRHSSYLAPKLEASISGDSWALLAAYTANWAPILILVSLTVLFLLTIPNAFTGIAHWLSGFSTRGPCLGKVLIVVGILPLAMFMGIIRRLTQFYRKPTEDVRVPHYVPEIVFLGAMISTGIASMALGGLMRMGEHPPEDGTFESFFYSWVGYELLPWRVVLAVIFLHISSGIFALLFVSKGAQGIMDGFRSWRLEKKMPSAGAMERTIKSNWGVFYGGATSCVVSCILAFQLARFLGPIDEKNFEHVIAIGPMAIFSILAASELLGSIITVRYRRDMDRAWAARVSGWITSSIALWTVASCFALWADPAIRVICSDEVVLLSTVATLLIGIAVAVWRKIPITWLIGGIVLSAYFLAIQHVFMGVFIKEGVVKGAWEYAAPTLVSLFFALIAAVAINVNRFSLHGLYKEGLVRTFLGASRLRIKNPGIKTPNYELRPLESEQFLIRKPDPITNIDEHDDPALSWLVPTADNDLPILLLNSALNGKSLTDDEGRAPRQWPFTFSSLFCGSPVSGVGYARTDDFFKTKGGKGLTLGTAMAVSGAAMSPTSGKSTKTIRAMLFGILNARLGIWLGNPSQKDAVARETPALAGFTILREMLGIRSPLAKWIHLSDGGHFENLGLYELLRRGCNRIIVIDASCDPAFAFSDFANAIRRARIDLGINITRREEKQILEHGERRKRPWVRSPDKSQWIGWEWYDIDYGEKIPKGRLFYVKPSSSGIESMPVEIVQYWKKSGTFPHETTADQFFSEAQMEAYRALGYELGKKALEAIDDPEFIQHMAIRGVRSTT